jgi:predicted metalloprotease
MRWTPGDISSDIEDRRGSRGGFGFGRGPTIGCGTAIILLVLTLLTGKNFFTLFDQSGGGPPTGGDDDGRPVNETPEERARVEFISDALDESQNTWRRSSRTKAFSTSARSCVVPRRHALRVRHGAGGERTVLLSRGRQGLSRSLILR